jgi:membrane-associated phospholipid phosphatase
MTPRLLPLDRWLLRNRREALILATALGAFVPICWFVIQAKGSFFGDDRFVTWMRFPRPSEPFAFIAHVFALLGNPVVAILSVAVVWALVDRHLGRRYGVLVLAAVSVIVLNTLLKSILGPTPRQRSLYVGGPVPASFPSGHVVYVTSLCSLVAWFALARGNRPIFVGMLLLILGMGPFRVVDGAHWPSDALAGYALGLGWTTVVLVIGLPWAASQNKAQSNRGPTIGRRTQWFL